jgi:hypothetical protein
MTSNKKKRKHAVWLDTIVVAGVRGDRGAISRHGEGARGK